MSMCKNMNLEIVCQKSLWADADSIMSLLNLRWEYLLQQPMEDSMPDVSLALVNHIHIVM